MTNQCQVWANSLGFRAWCRVSSVGVGLLKLSKLSGLSSWMGDCPLLLCYWKGDALFPRPWKVQCKACHGKVWPTDSKFNTSPLVIQVFCRVLEIHKYYRYLKHRVQCQQWTENICKYSPFLLKHMQKICRVAAVWQHIREQSAYDIRTTRGVVEEIHGT